MIKEPLVSVIIPTYNRASLIGETLDSIVSQSYVNFEIIIVDDRSTDQTTQLVRHYSNQHEKIHYFLRPREIPKGANACRNLGLTKSKGDYIVWFDSDDIMTPEFLEKGVKEFRKEESKDFVFFNYQIFESSTVNIIGFQKNKTNSPILDYFRGKINFSTCGVIWRRNSVLSLFNEKLDKSQELEFIFSNFKLNNQLQGKFIDHNAFYLRKHGNSIVNSYKVGLPRYLLSDIYVRSKILAYFENGYFPQIENYQREELSRSLFNFFSNAKFSEIFKFFQNQVPLHKLILLFLYRKIKKLTGREYRLKKILEDLSCRSYELHYFDRSGIN